MEPVDHKVGIGKAVFAEEGGTRFSSRAARAAHRDDAGFTVEAPLFKCRIDLGDKIRIPGQEEAVSFFRSLVAIRQ